MLPALVICGISGAIMLSIEAGHRFGIRQRSRDGAKFRDVHRTVEGSIFGLMALLLGFTFSGAASRFENRRKLAIDEANAIGTTYLRLDLLPLATQPEVREDLRLYLGSRLALYDAIPNLDAVNAARDRCSVLQTRIWQEVVTALRDSGPPDKTLVLTSLNEMLDLANSRTIALTTHLPTPIFFMLGLTVIASSALVGHSMSASAPRDWFSTISLALVLGFALYMILDYEYPRVGFIRLDPMDQVLVDTLNKMK
jgi:hypothetical protein